jgi:hypothetical protein
MKQGASLDVISNNAEFDNRNLNEAAKANPVNL